MKTNEVLIQLRHHYREHLSYCKQITNEIAAYMSNKGLGCTVFINDNLQIEIQYDCYLPLLALSHKEEIWIKFWSCLVNL